MVYLGDHYFQGLTAQSDYALARNWYEKGAGAGNAYGMRRLALLYLDGKGAAQDDALAAQWLQRALSAGDGTSNYYLGILSLNGWGVPKTVDRAIEFFLTALNQRNGFTAIQFRDRPDDFPLAVRKAVQSFLLAKGVLTGTTPDGTFGADTKAALDAWSRGP
jgi:TPR repeat protein